MLHKKSIKRVKRRRQHFYGICTSEMNSRTQGRRNRGVGRKDDLSSFSRLIFRSRATEKVNIGVCYRDRVCFVILVRIFFIMKYWPFAPEKNKK